MGFQNLRLPFVMFMIMLMISQQSDSRQLHIKISEGEKQTEKTESNSQVSWHFSAKAPEGANRDGVDPVVSNVSLRVVPAGPNPLHN